MKKTEDVSLLLLMSQKIQYGTQILERKRNKYGLCIM
jgi:hypothetical protein